jgi:hypothetical protein
VSANFSKVSNFIWQFILIFEKFALPLHGNNNINNIFIFPQPYDNTSGNRDAIDKWNAWTRVKIKLT